MCTFVEHEVKTHGYEFTLRCRNVVFGGPVARVSRVSLFTLRYDLTKFLSIPNAKVQ